MTTQQPPYSTTAPCPTNQKVGKPVDTLTLKALLSVPLTQLSEDEYRFCQAADCPTVYYSVAGGQLFSEADLRERVYQKHPVEDTVLGCYCFRYTVGSIRAELIQTGPALSLKLLPPGFGQSVCVRHS